MTHKKTLTIVGIVIGGVVLVCGVWFGKERVEQKAFQAGAASLITEVVNRTLDSCEPINLFVGEQKVDLVNVTCLNQSEDQAVTPEAETATE